MSTVRAEDPVIAILCADLHLSLQPPIARVGEKDWLKTQCKVLNQLELLAREYNSPILCAGDVFDYWKSPPELINFALENMAPMIAIPGQHDVPLHNTRDLHKSAFWTLVSAGKIQLPDSYAYIGAPRSGTRRRNVYIYGVRWGEPIPPVPTEFKRDLKVALIHKYIWIQGCAYPGAPEDLRLSSYKKVLKGYDVAVFGDNHQGFSTYCGKTRVFNCGTLLRRKADEIKYRPRVGLLTLSGDVIPEYLNIADDVITSEHRTTEEEEFSADFEEFVRQLSKLTTTVLDFNEVVKHMFETQKVKPEVRRAILEAMENAIVD